MKLSNRWNRFHGVTSLGLVGVAIVLAVVGMFQTSWVLGAVYVAICAVASPAILYMYCAKCPCRAHCGHVFPGKIAAMLFNGRPSGPYTSIEMAVTDLMLLVLIGLPQAWLWRYPGLFIAFWVLTVIAVIQIRTVVCRACDNIYCPAHKGSNLHSPTSAR